ncbi:hypothetical protein QZH41_018180 [Actinostola sp. cb2023]|nr:hypothetical protein QZH41_018180 [Actinostola sp. cb2023]
MKELKFWLKCRGDVAKGLKTKAQLIKRVYEYINSGKDKDIVDPDTINIYSRRRERNDANAIVSDSEAEDDPVQFPTDGWGTSLEKNRHVVKSGKRLANHHSVPTNLRKVKRFLEDKYP